MALIQNDDSFSFDIGSALLSEYDGDDFPGLQIAEYGDEATCPDKDENGKPIDDDLIVNPATRIKLQAWRMKSGMPWLQTILDEPKDYKIKNLIEGVAMPPEFVSKALAAIAKYEAHGPPPDERAAPDIIHRSFDVEQIRGINVAARSVDFVCSTSVIDRYGEVVEQSWQLEAFNKNPIVLFAHQSRELPIGRAENMRVTRVAGKDRLECTVVFATEKANPKAEQVFQLCVEKILRTVSVGFIPRSVRTETRDGKEVTVLADNELCELSVTPVPANPEALAKHLARAKTDAPVARPAASPRGTGDASTRAASDTTGKALLRRVKERAGILPRSPLEDQADDFHGGDMARRAMRRAGIR